MREESRRQYLKALGVPCLVPRFILPGAAVSRRCEMPVVSPRVLSPQALSSQALSSQVLSPQVLPQSPSASERQPQPDPVSSSVSPQALMRALMDSPAQAKAPVNPSRDPAAEISSGQKPDDRRSATSGSDGAAAPRSAQPGAATVRFSLTLCRGEDWLVIDEGPAPNRGYLALLGNLLHACGHSSVIQGEDFLWPPSLSMPQQLDLSAAAAGQVLASRLQTLHHRQPLTRLLLLGRRLPQLLDGWAGAEGIQRLDLPASLWRAMAEPRLKRELWLGLAAAGWL